MTALQCIVKEAKKLKKEYPKRFASWKEYVAQASAIYAKKHKGHSPVGKKKKKIGNVTLKKANYHKNDERYIIMNDGKVHLEGKPFFKSEAKHIAEALRKVKKKRKQSVSGIKKKAAKKSSAKSYHKDTKSHNVNIRVISGIEKTKFYL